MRDVGATAGSGTSRNDQIIMKRVIKPTAQANNSAQCMVNLSLKSVRRIRQARKVDYPWEGNYHAQTVGAP
jgi:hypothetical protein